MSEEVKLEENAPNGVLNQCSECLKSNPDLVLLWSYVNSSGVAAARDHDRYSDARE
jgi:hypothetical protein